MTMNIDITTINERISAGAGMADSDSSFGAGAPIAFTRHGERLSPPERDVVTSRVRRELLCGDDASGAGVHDCCGNPISVGIGRR